MSIATILSRYKRSLWICGVCLLGTPALQAQHIDLENANAYFSSYLFKDAIPLYERVIEREPSSSIAILRLAECYRFINDLPEAAKWYEKALTFPENKAAAYEYAQTLKGLKRYDEAKALAVRYAVGVDSIRGYALAATCDFAKSNMHNNRAVPLFNVTNLQEINSKSADFAPVFYGDKLLFASSRSVAVEKEKSVTWTNDAFNQYYLAVPAQGKANAFSEATPLRNIIAKDINDAPMAYAQNGNIVAITSNNFMDGIRHISGSGMMMDIYLYQTQSMSEWKEGSEVFFPYNASVDEATPFSTGHPYLTQDGKAIYFTSNRPGGFGGYDIYVSYKTTSGTWTAPKNLGYPINTPGNEVSPFVDEKGRLFFSSDFHAGFGGLDVFTAEQLPFGFTNVQNLGNAVNSPNDDMYFIYDAKKQIGYFTSNRAGGKGFEDIYMAQQMRAFPARQTQTLALGEQTTFYGITHTKNNELILSNEEHERLHEVLLALYDNPDVLVQLHAFTDSRGDDNENKAISKQRAALLKEYLRNKGINEDRISAQGYGEEYLVNNCTNGKSCSETKHLLNRRIEITYVGRKMADGTTKMEYDATPDTRVSSRRQYIDPHTRTRPRQLNTVSSFVVQNNNPVLPKTEIATITETAPTKPVEQAKETVAEKPQRQPVKIEASPATTPSKNTTERKPIRKEHYAIGDKIDIANIYYEHNKSNVDENNSPGLKEILEVLIDQPYIRVEIGAHTDANGAANYNLELSKKRAQAVKNYLVKKGIPAARLVAKGYGEAQLLNRCKDGVKCSDEEHAENRRTEFKVIGQQGHKVGDIIQVAAINYQKNSVKFDMNNSAGLQEILKLLKENANLKVEVRSHTDAKGSDSYNLEISEKRAKAVYDYLVENGIAANRLTYKGYGETMLINKCKNGVNCTEAQHAANRRTDFKVMAIK